MKPIYILVLVIITTNCFAQKDRKLSFYLSLQADAAMYDNAVFYQSRGLGLGAGLQINFNTKTMFKPTLEINADCFTGFVKPIGLPPGTEYVEFTPGVMSPYMGLFVLPLKWGFFLRQHLDQVFIITKLILV